MKTKASLKTTILQPFTQQVQKEALQTTIQDHRLKVRLF